MCLGLRIGITSIQKGLGDQVSIRRLIIGLLLIIAVNAHAEPNAESTEWRQAVVIPSFFGMGDSEGFNTYRYRTGLLPLYEHGDRYTGVEYQRNQFSQNGWHSFANETRLITKAINPRSGLGYNLNIGLNRENGFSLVTTDSQYGFNLSDKLNAEIILNRDRVETQNAINNNIFYTMAGASLEYKPFERVTLIGMGGDMFFSDTNTRAFMKLRAIYTLLPEYGVTLQARYRQYHDSNVNVTNNYFNPENYYEGMLALAIRKRINGWMLNGTAGLGQQGINNQSTTTTQLLEAGATSPISGNLFFRSRLGYGRSAGFLGPDYSYQYIMEELIYAF